MNANTGFLGSGPYARATVRRLAGRGPVIVLGSGADAALATAGARIAASAADLARDCAVVVLGFDAPSEVREALFGKTGLATVLSRGTLVVDQTGGDPEDARRLAGELGNLGIAYVDAPIHCESTDLSTRPAAILCGGAADAVARARPWLETICPKVIHCGDVGSGCAARAIATAVATCNRYVTYECAAMGMQSGLTAADLAEVIGRSSGNNSGIDGIVPHLESGRRTADTPVKATLDDLHLVTRLGMRHGAPMIIAGNLCNGLESARHLLGDEATLDDLARAFAEAAGIALSESGGWRPARG